MVFLNITLSSALKHITRQDGEDLNGVTVMIMALLNHFPSLREMCWADDVTRAGCDKADWTQITTKCQHRDITMVGPGPDRRRGLAAGDPQDTPDQARHAVADEQGCDGPRREVRAR